MLLFVTLRFPSAEEFWTLGTMTLTYSVLTNGFGGFRKNNKHTVFTLFWSNHKAMKSNWNATTVDRLMASNFVSDLISVMSVVISPFVLPFCCCTPPSIFCGRMSQKRDMPPNIIIKYRSSVNYGVIDWTISELTDYVKNLQHYFKNYNFLSFTLSLLSSLLTTPNLTLQYANEAPTQGNQNIELLFLLSFCQKSWQSGTNESNHFNSNTSKTFYIRVRVTN